MVIIVSTLYVIVLKCNFKLGICDLVSTYIGNKLRQNAFDIYMVYIFLNIFGIWIKVEFMVLI